MAEGEHRSVAIPALEGARTVVVRTSSRALYGKVAVAGGAGLGLAALVLGLYARDLYWSQFPAASRDGKDAYDLFHDCYTVNGMRGCNVTGENSLHTARTVSGVATGVGIAGGLALAAGAYLWLTAPTNVAVDVGADHAAVAITSRW